MVVQQNAPHCYEQPGHGSHKAKDNRMSNLMVSAPRPVVNATRFVAKSEFEQGKHNYRHGLPLKSCGTDEMADGWLFCQEHGERHGWMRNPDARGADAYGRAMMQQASTEVM